MNDCVYRNIMCFNHSSNTLYIMFILSVIQKLTILLVDHSIKMKMEKKICVHYSRFNDNLVTSLSLSVIPL